LDLNGDEASLDIVRERSPTGGGAGYEKDVAVATGASGNERGRRRSERPMLTLPLHLFDRLLRHADQDIERVSGARHAGVPVAMHRRQAQLRPPRQRLLPDHEPPRLSGACGIAGESVSGSAALHIALPPREHRVLALGLQNQAARDRQTRAKLLIFKWRERRGSNPRPSA